MAKKNIANTATTDIINGVAITINQRLHGIEVKGELNAKDDAWVRENGFYFSKRKGHYWTAFNADLYKKVCEHFRKSAKPKAKGKTVTIAEAAPINMKDMPSVDNVKPTKTSAKKQSKKTTAKKETVKPATDTAVIDLSAIQTRPKGDDLEEWKRLVILAVEKILDEAIETMAAEVA